MAWGLIFDVKKYAIHDGPGIRTTFFLKGCPLDCLWCHNPESKSSLPAVVHVASRCIGCLRCINLCEAITPLSEGGGINFDLTRCSGCAKCAVVCPGNGFEIAGRTMTEREVLREALKDEIFYDQSGGGVTFSGGEPLSQAEFLCACLKICKENGLHTCVDTCGFAQKESFTQIMPYTDIFLFDLKHMNPQKHKEYMGVDNELILSNLKYLDEAGACIDIRIPLIPGLNDDEENLISTGRFISSLKSVNTIHLLPYHSIGKSKYPKWGMDYRLEDTLAPTERQIKRAVSLLSSCLDSTKIEIKIGG